MLKGITAIGGGRSPVFAGDAAAVNQQISAQLKNALFDDIGRVAPKAGRTPNPTPAQQAVNLLLETRSRYGDMERKVEAMADSALATTFGANRSGRPADLLKFIRSAHPEDQAELVKLLGTGDAPALRAVRAEAVQDAWRQSFDPTAPKAMNAFSLPKFATELAQLEQSGLFNTKQVGEIMKTANGVRIILNRVEGSLGPAPAAMPSDIGINAVSMNPAFVARLIVKMTQRGQLDRILFTKAGQEAVTTLATTGSTSAKMTAAVATLASLFTPGQEDRDTRVIPRQDQRSIPERMGAGE
jgi:hypothetical protein